MASAIGVSVSVFNQVSNHGESIMVGNKRRPNSAGWFWVILAIALVSLVVYLLTTSMPWLLEGQ